MTNAAAPPSETLDVARAALAQIETATQSLAGLDLGAIVDDDLLALMRDHERVIRRQTAVGTYMVAETDRRGAAATKGYKNTASLLRDLLRIAPYEASARVKLAADTAPRRSLLGQPLAPIFTRVAAAHAAGAISDQHARLIVKTVDKLPIPVQDEQGEWVEQFLTENALQFDPTVLSRLATRTIDHLDPDGILRDEAYRRRIREFGLIRHQDGSSTPTGSFTAELTEYLLVAMDALAGPAPAEDGTRDPRTPAQRRHDALAETLKIAISTGLVPKAGGLTSTLVLTMDEQSLTTGQGLAKTSHGALIPAQNAIEWMLNGGSAYLLGVALNSMKAISAYSSTHRIFTEQQRLAMFGRDGGFCTMPGCDAPPGMAEAHHVTDYAVTGRTSVDDGAWACCTDHEDRIQQGWTTTMLNGRPHWIPPPWLDPDQRPRRNTWNDL